MRARDVKGRGALDAGDEDLRVDRRGDEEGQGPERRSGKDRRRSRRVPLSLDIAVPVLVRGPDGPQQGLARNFSEGGMLIQMKDLPPIGAQLEVTLTGQKSPGDVPPSVTLRGEVRHQVAWRYQAGGAAGTFRGVGVRFLDHKEDVERWPAVTAPGPRVLH